MKDYQFVFILGAIWLVLSQQGGSFEYIWYVGSMILNIVGLGFILLKD